MQAVTEQSRLRQQASRIARRNVSNSVARHGGHPGPRYEHAAQPSPPATLRDLDVRFRAEGSTGFPHDSSPADCALRIPAPRGSDAGQTRVLPVVQDTLSSPGQPLDSVTRASMEPLFGHDLSQVRVHADARAADSARAVNALAYTVGRDIVFHAGAYSPGTPTGRALLAHELVHVMQQRCGAPTVSRLRLGGPAAAAEQEAHRVTADISRGRPVNVHLNTVSGLVQRQLCGGQPLPPCPTGYISVPSNSAIGNTVGSWIGLKYREDVMGSSIKSYLLVDHNLYYRGEHLKRDDLSQRTSKTRPPRPGLDPDVYTALQTHELFQGLRPDILDSDRDDLYEIKPVRGAGAGPAQLSGYLRRLRRLAATAPAWLGNRSRDWKAGTWRPQLQLPVASGAQPGLVCVYPDDTAGVILYDLLRCRPKRRRTPQVEEPARDVASESLPAREPVRHDARLRVVGSHPYFGELANRLSDMRAAPGREFILVIDDELFQQVDREEQRQHLEQQRRLLRPDPRGMPIVQAGRSLPYLAIIAGVAALPLIVAIVAPLAVAATATAGATVATGAATTEAAVTSTIVVPATIAARVASTVAAAEIAAPATTWAVTQMTSAAAVAAVLIAQGVPEAYANTAAEAMKPYIGRRVLAMADMTANPQLASVGPGQAISLEGQTFRAIIRFSTTE
jgi:hypothetical protein